MIERGRKHRARKLMLKRNVDQRIKRNSKRLLDVLVNTAHEARCKLQMILLN